MREAVTGPTSQTKRYEAAHADSKKISQGTDGLRQKKQNKGGTNDPTDDSA